jgi:hypothetical protein
VSKQKLDGQPETLTSFDPTSSFVAPPKPSEDLKGPDIFRALSRTLTDAYAYAFRVVSADSHPVHYDEVLGSPAWRFCSLGPSPVKVRRTIMDRPWRRTNRDTTQVNCRNWVQNILSRQIAGGFIATAPIIITFAALTVATQVFAQSSLDSSSAPATDYALPPPGGSQIEPAMPDDPTTEDATPDEDTRSDAISSAGVPSNQMAAAKNHVRTAENGSARAEEHSGWDRVGVVDAATDDDDQADNVLEVPQVLPSADPQPSDDSDQTAQQDGSQSSGDHDPTPDQVGSIENYEDEEEGAIMCNKMANSAFLPSAPSASSDGNRNLVGFMRLFVN